MRVNFEVKPILAGKFGLVRDDIKYRGGDAGNQEMVPSYVFHIKSGMLNVLVDMSFSSVEKCEKLTGLKCEREGAFEDILERNGVNRFKIDTVICTHLHWDHAGNGRLFPNARIICQRDELPWALTPPAWEMGYSREFSSEIIEVLDRIDTIDGNITIHEGLQVVKLGGHTMGSQALVVDTCKGKVVITGDVVMTSRNIEEEVPIGLFVNLNQCMDAIKWLKGQNAVILPGHSWDVLQYSFAPVKAPCI